MSRQARRLATVLRVRRLQEEHSRADHARALAHLSVADDAARDAESRYLTSVAQPAATSVDAGAWQARRRTTAGLAGVLAAAETGYAAAQQQSERTRARLTEARTRTSGLERLVERAEAARIRDLLAADQAAAEESASASWAVRP